jgi:predicted permease
MVLGVLGGAAGLALGEAVRGLLEQALSSTAPGRGAILEPRVLAFGLATTALTGLLVSVLPVLHVYRSSPAAALRAGGTTLACLGRRRSRRALVVAEVAVAFVLVFAAGILVRTVVGLLREDPGFRSKGVVTFRIAPPQIAPGPDQTEESFVAALLEDRDRVASFYARTVERLRALPAVRAAAAVNRLPLTGGWWVMSFEIPGRPSTTPGDDKPAFGRVVVPGYFHTMGMSLRAGRDFDWGDAAGALPAVIVDEALARREFGNESPLGARLRIDGRAEARVVGVVGSTRFAIDRPGSPTFYVPLAQAEFGFYPDWGMDVVVRSDLESSRLLPLVREAVRDLDASLPLFSVRTLDEVVAASVGTRQGTLRLLGAFSVVALLLAGIGLYGVLAQLARERTREFGIRLALGAPARQLAALVLADGLRLSALGAMLGGLLALGAGRLLASLLHGVGPGDPLTLGAAAALMGAVATIASLPSVRRACRLDPARILRAE